MNQSKVRCLGRLGHTCCCWKAVLVPSFSIPQGKSTQTDATVCLLCPHFKPAACKLQSRSHVTTLALTVPAREICTQTQDCAITDSYHPSEEEHVRATWRVCWLDSRRSSISSSRQAHYSLRLNVPQVTIFS